MYFNLQRHNNTISCQFRMRSHLQFVLTLADHRVLQTQAEHISPDFKQKSTQERFELVNFRENIKMIYQYLIAFLRVFRNGTTQWLAHPMDTLTCELNSTCARKVHSDRSSLFFTEHKNETALCFLYLRNEHTKKENTNSLEEKIDFINKKIVLFHWSILVSFCFYSVVLSTPSECISQCV